MSHYQLSLFYIYIKSLRKNHEVASSVYFSVRALTSKNAGNSRTQQWQVHFLGQCPDDRIFNRLSLNSKSEPRINGALRLLPVDNRCALPRDMPGRRFIFSFNEVRRVLATPYHQ